jgi:hypothetical protein
LPFATYADDFLDRHRVTETPATFEAFLAKRYVRTELGIFDVWLPSIMMQDRRAARTLTEAVITLLEVQEQWIAWVGDDKVGKQAQKDLDQVARWVGAWKPAMFKDMMDVEGNFVVLSGAKAKVIEASDRFREVMRSGRLLGREEEEGKGISILFSPDREDFLGLGSFLGTLSNRHQRMLWRNNLAMWTSFKRGDVHVLALEHPSTWPGRGDVMKGIDMNSREKTGMSQHVAQHATDYLVTRFFGRDLHPDVRTGLAINMVIELYGENNVRAGGGTKGRKTAAYTQFVAGGNSSGGRLAARNADIHWRQDKGRDFFVSELRAAQKSGAKKALKVDGRKRDKTAYFSLLPDSGIGEPILAKAPFLLEGSDREPVPETHSDEWLEFRRAYRSAFTHWLMTQAAGRGKSEELFRKLLHATGETPFEKAVDLLYDVPLSTGSSSVESLEWRFLAWLSKRR